MANKCQACEELRNDAPAFVQNGVTTAVCNSLKNNTGLSTTNGNDNAEDLQNAIDCLIGNMESELAAYDVCDWKDFMKALIPNLYNTMTALLCGDTGQWSKLAQLECEIKYLYNGASFKIGEEKTDGSYVVAGKGVSFYLPTAASEHTSDVYVQYIGGGLGRMSGACYFFSSDFTDAKETVNFDNGSTERTSIGRKGNSIWATTGRPATGGELVYEVRILKSQYPQLKTIYRGNAIESMGGHFTCQYYIFNGGSYAWGQHGVCHEAGRADAGQPTQEGYDAGHLVPDGWIYIQCRMSYITQMNANGSQYTPYGWLGMRMNRDEIDC